MQKESSVIKYTFDSIKVIIDNNALKLYHHGLLILTAEKKFGPLVPLIELIEHLISKVN